jgi:DNA ligase-1
MWPAPAEDVLQQQLGDIDTAGGEGVVLHRRSGLYLAGRSDNQLKLKLHQDAEARVVAYTPGRGKYQGMIGALVVETTQGVQFKIGSGLSDAQRREPPAIGSWVTYRFNGTTTYGKPRFARFLRIYHPI